MSQSPYDLEFLPEHLIFLAECIENEEACTDMLRAVYQKYRGIDGSPINVSQVAFWHSYLSQTKARKTEVPQKNRPIAIKK